MKAVVYLDTNVFISAFESSTARSQAMWTILEAIAGGELRGVTSELTLAELLPRPLSLGQTELSDSYNTLLSGRGSIEVASVTRAILTHTAALRSKHRALKLPDAIHLATAIQRDCTVVLSDDRRMPLPASMRPVRLTIDSLELIRKDQP